MHHVEPKSVVVVVVSCGSVLLTEIWWKSWLPVSRDSVIPLSVVTGIPDEDAGRPLDTAVSSAMAMFAFPFGFGFGLPLAFAGSCSGSAAGVALPPLP